MRTRQLFVLVVAACLVAAIASAGVARTQGSEPTFLGQPTWSADGTRVAWVAGPPNGYGTIWVANASGRDARPLHQFGQSLLGDDAVEQIEWLSPKSLLVSALLSDQPQLF